jgi:hypothetical protein
MLKKRRRWPKAISNWKVQLEAVSSMIKRLKGQKTGRKEQNRKKIDGTKRLHLFLLSRELHSNFWSKHLCIEPLDFFKAVAAAAVYTKR